MGVRHIPATRLRPRSSFDIWDRTIHTLPRCQRTREQTEYKLLLIGLDNKIGQTETLD